MADNFAIDLPHPRTHKSLRRCGQRDDAEAKRHAQMNVALEEFDRFDRKTWDVRVGHKASAFHSMPSNL
jgi:hypothetical protein